MTRMSQKAYFWQKRSIYQNKSDVIFKIYHSSRSTLPDYVAEELCHLGHMYGGGKVS